MSATLDIAAELGRSRELLNAVDTAEKAYGVAWQAARGTAPNSLLKSREAHASSLANDARALCRIDPRDYIIALTELQQARAELERVQAMNHELVALWRGIGAPMLLAAAANLEQRLAAFGGDTK